MSRRRRRGIVARRRLNLFDPAVITTSFEGSNTTGWVGQSHVASLTSVASNPGHGSRSMLVTSDATGGPVGPITSGYHPCVPTVGYWFSFHATTTLAVQLWVNWYNSSLTFLSQNGVNLGAPASGAARLSSYLVAPAGATSIRVYIEVLAVPANGTFNLDAIQYESGLGGSVASAYEA